MDLVVGQIIPSGTVTRQEIRGNFWFVSFESKGKKYDGILERTFISSGIQIERNLKIENFVVLECNDLRIRIALSNYFFELTKFYYKKFTPANIIISNWEWWFNVFDKSKTNFRYNRNYVVNGPIREIKSVESKTRAKNMNPFLDFYELRNKYYVLPVAGYKDLVNIDGASHFYPSVIYKNKSGRSVYKSNYLSKTYCGKIDGLIIGKQKMAKDVRVIIHGITSPAKWHYNIWKHLIQEKELSNILKINPTNISDDIFINCKRNKEDTSCNEIHCISQELFPKVHEKIKDLYSTYLDYFVTYFAKDTIKRLLNVSFVHHAAYKLLNMNCFFEIENNSYLLFVFRGICYNWDEPVPILHFSPLTLYPVKKIKLPITNDNSISFFMGNLKEIKNEEHN